MATKKIGRRDFARRLQKSAEAGQGDEKYILRLYIAGLNPKSTRAVANIRKLCETYLPGRYELSVVDIYQQPEFAKGDEIVAAPTLVKRLPPPLRRFIGSLTDTERLLVGLAIKRSK